MRLTNRKTADEASNPDERLFPEEGSAEGCASGECLPAAAPVEDASEDELSDPAAAPLTRAGRPPPTWRDAVEAVKAVSGRHGTSLGHARLLGIEPRGMRLAFGKEAAFHRATVTGNGKAQIEKTLTELFQRPMQLFVEESDQAYASAAPSVAEVDAKGKAEREKSAESRIRTHPAVRATLKLLGGEIEHIQVLEEPRPAPAPAPPDD